MSELPYHVQVLPAHGAGSACGKALGSIPNSTLGYEEKFNLGLKLGLNESEDAFVNFNLSGQPELPAYFAVPSFLERFRRRHLSGWILDVALKSLSFLPETLKGARD